MLRNLFTIDALVNPIYAVTLSQQESSKNPFKWKISQYQLVDHFSKAIHKQRR